MPFSHLPPLLGSFFADLARWLDRRSAARLPALLLGALLARGRRTVSSWIRAAGLSHDWRQAYVTLCAAGRRAEDMALTAQAAAKGVLDRRRLLVGVDDTPTPRYGPYVEGAGVHRNPSPGPAGERHVYGHNWVLLSALGKHPRWGSLALPLQAQLYIRAKDVAQLPPERARPFRTKLQLAAGQLDWLGPWVSGHFQERWVAVDGGYAKRPFLRPARAGGWVVVGRLRKDAALRSVPPPKPAGRPGPQATYGKGRISLAKRAGQGRGWEQVECVQYGERVSKAVKTFLATYRPAGGLIRVVIVREDDGWVPFFCTDPNASAAEVLEAAADRGAVEQMHKDVKEVWGAGQQQVRNVYSNEGCFNINLWLHTLTEVWAWGKADEELSDRSASPWDREPRRPSHADKRRALRREVLRAEIEQALSGRPTKQRIRELAEWLLELAA